MIRKLLDSNCLRENWSRDISISLKWARSQKVLGIKDSLGIEAEYQGDTIGNSGQAKRTSYMAVRKQMGS